MSSTKRIFKSLTARFQWFFSHSIPRKMSTFVIFLYGDIVFWILGPQANSTKLKEEDQLNSWPYVTQWGEDSWKIKTRKKNLISESLKKTLKSP